MKNFFFVSGRLPRSSSQVQRVKQREREKRGRKREGWGEGARGGGWRERGGGGERESVRCALLVRCCASPATRDRGVCGATCRGPLKTYTLFIHNYFFNYRTAAPPCHVSSIHNFFLTHTHTQDEEMQKLRKDLKGVWMGGWV